MADFARGDDDKGKGKKPRPGVNLVLGKSRPPKAVFKDDRCRVCTSPHRDQIELLLVQGMSLKKIAEFFERFAPPGESPISRQSLGLHLQKHTDLTSSAIRHALEKWATSHRGHLEEVEGTILNVGGMLDALLIKGWESVLHDEVEFKPKDLLDIMERIQKLEMLKDNSDYEHLKTESLVFAEAVQSLVPRELWQSIVDRWELGMEERDMTLEQHLAIESTAEETTEEENDA